MHRDGSGVLAIFGTFAALEARVRLALAKTICNIQR